MRHLAGAKFINRFGDCGDKPIECDNCSVKHKITIPGRLIFVSLAILPMLIFANYISFFTSFNNIIATLGMGLAIFLLALCLHRIWSGIRLFSLDPVSFKNRAHC